MFRHLKVAVALAPARSLHLRAVLAAGLMLLAALGFGAGPATASTVPPGSVQVVVSDSAFSSTNKQVQAFCPQGKRVLGGGGLITGNNNVVIVESRPFSPAIGDTDDPRDGFLVAAAEDQTNTTGSWLVRAYAFCAVAPPGLQIVVAMGSPTSVTVGHTVAQCPPGKGLVGQGGRIFGGAGQVDLGMLPPSQGIQFSADTLVKEDADGFAGLYQPTSYAVCATWNQVTDLMVVHEGTDDSQPNKKAFASCPIGYRLTGVAGVTTVPGTHLVFFKPTTAISPTVVEVAATATTPLTDWDVIAIAYCAQ
jgi:hypothetical protein